MIPPEAALASSTVADVYGDARLIASLTRLAGEGAVLGTVRTVRCEPGTIQGAIALIDRAEPGDALMFGTLDDASERHCLIGGMMALAAARRGVGALIVDGYVRDLAEIRGLGLTVFARGTEISSTSVTGSYELHGQARIDGVRILTGDRLIADDDGIALVGERDFEETLVLVRERHRTEQRVRERILQGDPLARIYAPAH